MKDTFFIQFYKSFVGNRRIDRLSKIISHSLPDDVKNLLDLGAGTGQIAFNILKKKPNLKVLGVDTLIRSDTFISIKAYDGKKLPFKDNKFDCVMTIDVLHHTDNPIEVLKEMKRASNKYILIKDHIANSTFDRFVLKVMDYIGNRLYGVVLPYNYLSNDLWLNAFKQTNLEIIKEVKQFNLYPWPFDLIFGRKLHCLYLLKKKKL